MPGKQTMLIKCSECMPPACQASLCFVPIRASTTFIT